MEQEAPAACGVGVLLCMSVDRRVHVRIYAFNELDTANHSPMALAGCSPASSSTAAQWTHRWNSIHLHILTCPGVLPSFRPFHRDDTLAHRHVLAMLKITMASFDSGFFFGKDLFGVGDKLSGGVSGGFQS